MSSTATQPATRPKTAWIVVNSPLGEREVHVITTEINLIVGSSPTCSVRLDGAAISSMHCLIGLQEGRLSVQDWYTASGTYLNGQRITDPATFGPGDEVRIGDYLLTGEFEAVEPAISGPLADVKVPQREEYHEPKTAPADWPALVVGRSGESNPEALEHPSSPIVEESTPQAVEPSTPELIEAPVAEVDEPSTPEPVERSPFDPAGASGTDEVELFTSKYLSPSTLETLQQETPADDESPAAKAPESARDWNEPPPEDEATREAIEAVRSLRTEISDGELESLRQRVTELELENEELRQQQSLQTQIGFADAADPFDREMLDLLKAEVNELQSEVAQRDERIADLEADGASTSEPGVEQSEVEGLVERLEQLLVELDAGDERIGTLEDLLQAADDATRAEQEERRQLSDWASEIEERIAQRESEWQAEQERLKEQIEGFSTERERFDAQLKDLMKRQGSTAQAHLVTELREQMNQLAAQLETSEQARQGLQKQIDDTQFQKTVEGQNARLEEMLREERLQMAQDRAEITRERAAISRMKAEFEVSESTNSRNVDEATCRVRAFREHLKDIHNNDSRKKIPDKPAPEKGGLASRLSRLWKRLEG